MLRAGYMDEDSIVDPFHNYQAETTEETEDEKAAAKAHSAKAAEANRLMILKEEAIFDVDPNSAAVKLEMQLAESREAFELERKEHEKKRVELEKEKQQMADELMKSQLELAQLASLNFQGGMEEGAIAGSADSAVMERLNLELRETRARLMASETMVEELEARERLSLAEVQAGDQERVQLKESLNQAQMLFREKGSTKLAAAFSAPALERSKAPEGGSSEGMRNKLKETAASLRQKRNELSGATKRATESMSDELEKERMRLTEALEDHDALDAIMDLIVELTEQPLGEHGAHAAVARELLKDAYVSRGDLEKQLEEREQLLGGLQEGMELLEEELLQKEVELSAVTEENGEMFEEFQNQLSEMEEALEEARQGNRTEGSGASKQGEGTSPYELTRALKVVSTDSDSY